MSVNEELRRVWEEKQTERQEAHTDFWWGNFLDGKYVEDQKQNTKITHR
jgi:hypothetical protein